MNNVHRRPNLFDSAYEYTSQYQERETHTHNSSRKKNGYLNKNEMLINSKD